MSKSHHHASSSDMGAVLGALALIAVFFVVEIVAAILGSSLVLFADAGHMITDVSALAMSAWALRLARRPAEALRGAPVPWRRSARGGIPRRPA